MRLTLWVKVKLGPRHGGCKFEQCASGNFASVTIVAAFECVSKDVKRELGTPGEHVLNGRNFRQIIPRHNYFVFSPGS